MQEQLPEADSYIVEPTITNDRTQELSNQLTPYILVGLSPNGEDLALLFQPQFKELEQEVKSRIVFMAMELLLRAVDTHPLFTIFADGTDVSFRSHNPYVQLSLTGRSKYLRKASELARSIASNVDREREQTSESIM